MEQLFQLIAAVLAISIMGSTVLIFLFAIALGNHNGLRGSTPSERRYHAVGLSRREYAMQCIPEKHRRKYLFLLDLQKYCVIAVAVLVCVVVFATFLTRV